MLLWGRASEEDGEVGEIEGNCVKVIRALGTRQKNGPEPQKNYTTISQLDTHTHADTRGIGARVRVSYIPYKHEKLDTLSKNTPN